jgi:hypothetical protein
MLHLQIQFTWQLDRFLWEFLLVLREKLVNVVIPPWASQSLALTIIRRLLFSQAIRSCELGQ